MLFTDAHEATHAMCRWHEDILRLDTEDELFERLVFLHVEAEANFGAGHLIFQGGRFQGGRFHRAALSDQVWIRAPIALAKAYGASRHAAVHYYTQEHPDAVALLVESRYTQCDGTLPVWRSVGESPDFLRHFGRLRDRLPDQRLSIVEGDRAPSPRFSSPREPRSIHPARPSRCPTSTGASAGLLAEAFYNGYCNLVFVAEARAGGAARRVVLAS